MAAGNDSAKLQNVKLALREMLPSLDLEQTTERMIRERLAVQLGVPIDEFKPVIKVGRMHSHQGAPAWAAAGSPRHVPCLVYGATTVLI